VVKIVCDRKVKICVTTALWILLAGEGQQQTNQPNDQAGD